MFHLLFLYFLLVEPIFGYKKHKNFANDFKDHGGAARKKYYNFTLLWEGISTCREPNNVIGFSENP